MKTGSTGILEDRVIGNANGPQKPNEVPIPGKTPEGDPAQEPEPSVWPRKTPEIQPEKEPPTAPPSAPPEVPRLPESVTSDLGVDLKAGKYRSMGKKALKNIRSLLTESAEPFSIETVHELRTEIKKLDAVFTLLRSVNGSKKVSRLFKPYARLFKRSGKLRSAQIEFILIERYLTGEGSVQYLHDLSQRKQEQFHVLDDFITARFLKKLKVHEGKIADVIDRLGRKNIVHYLERREQYLTKFLQRNIFREQQLHRVRKALKRFYLNLKGGDVSAAEQWSGLLKQLGDWHDVQVAFDHIMKTVYSRALGAYDLAPLYEIKDQLYCDKALQVERIAREYERILSLRDKELK